MSTPLISPPGRETRLLLATIGLSIGVLLLLARFRFPEERRPELTAAATAPLERLAARATYDELAGIIAELETRVLGSVVTLRVEATDGTRTFVPGLLVRDDVVLASIAPDTRVTGVVGDEEEHVPSTIATDRLRRLVAVRIPVRTAPTISLAQTPAAGVRPRYFVAAESSPGGAALRPVFFGRLDPFNDVRWPEPLFALGAAGGAIPGTVVFGLDGRLAGLVVSSGEMVGLVPASTLMNVADAMIEGHVAPYGDLGVDVQPVSAAVTRATGATRGVTVTRVAADGPSHELLQAGDVIQAVNGTSVTTVDAFVALVASRGVDVPVRLTVLRDGQAVEVTVTTGDDMARTEGERTATLGLDLRAAPGGGAEVVRVWPHSAAAAAAVRAGDVITRAGGVHGATPRDVTRVWTAAASGTSILLVVDRDNRSLVLALDKP